MNEELLISGIKDENMNREISELRQLYLSTIDNNLRIIGEIVGEVQISDSIPVEQFKNMLDRSSQSLVDKWKSGRKSLRTEIAVKVLPKYPSAVLKTSLMIDAIINLLDDNLDELMTKEERVLNIVELVRATAIFNQQPASNEIKQRISGYFNKVLCIGISEILYGGKIKASGDFSQQLQYLIQCYDCKSLVTDIFFELPLLELYGNDKRIKDIVSLARIHRAVHQIKKDYRDLEWDIKNHTETPIIILSKKEGSVGQYMDAMMEHYEKESRKFEPAHFSEGFRTTIERLMESISEEVDEYRNEPQNITR